jgi:putative CocE/NonD family hydrolase
MTNHRKRFFWLTAGLLLATSAEAQSTLTPVYKVRNDRAVMIPARDGKRLSADLFRPDAEGRFPVIVEYHPYRKDDVGRGGAGIFHYFAERGFVAVRLDARGTGTSEGFTTDEYRLIEQQDGYDAVEWLARQSFSNGNVGMFGTSYSGFTALQVAALGPPHLKAIVPIYATDDRYTDDCHYDRGGNLRMYYDVGTYGGWMVAMNALPPMPELAGARWAEMWRERLEANTPYLLEWIRHPVDGPYWRNGSLRPDYGRIRIPVFLIAGWHDGYVNAMLRTYVNLKSPKKLLVGPWVHTQPHPSQPGPRIDWMHEAARFFAHWLRDEETGIMREPPLAFYMQEYAPPDRTLEVIPGAWRADADFPVPRTQELTWYLAPEGRLAPKPGADGFDEYEYKASVGLTNAYWSAGGVRYYLAEDQRADEAYSLVYTSPPFQEETHILGWPQVVLHASSTARVAAFVAKLNVVAPGGASLQLVDGALNATRRNSLTDPEPLEPGQAYELKIPMDPTGFVIRPGYRLRLAIAGADFPNLWPTPERATSRIWRGGGRPSRVILPVVPRSKLAAPSFLPPPVLTSYVRSAAARAATQQVIYDQISGAVTVVMSSAGSTYLDGNLGEVISEREFRATASPGNPAQASISGLHKVAFRREDGLIEAVAESSIRSTETDLHLVINLQVRRNGLPFFSRQWLLTEPRRLF